MSKDKPVILFIDVMNMFVRNFSSLNFTNDNGEHVGGIFGSLQSLRSVCERFKPDVVYCAWEGKGSTKKRKKLNPEYKAGRTFRGFNRGHFDKSEEDEKEAFSRQASVLRAALQHLPVFQSSIDFLEADDVIAYVATRNFTGCTKIMVTCDRDYWQLLDEHTTIFRPIRKKVNKEGEIIRMTEYEPGQFGIGTYHAGNGEQEDLLKCHPGNYMLTKVVGGDASDNISGIKGVGEKTLLRDFPFLDSLKADGHIYSTSDIVEVAKERSEQPGGTKYKKYLIEENTALMLRNQDLVQLLDPDISLKSVDDIQASLTTYVPRFNPMKFRLTLVKENISPRRIDSWTETFQRIRPEKVEIG